MAYKIGDIIEGTVTEIRPYGALLIFDDDQKGMLHISEISNFYIHNLKRYVCRGRTYRVKIIDIADNGFLRVSLTKITPEEKETFHENNDKNIVISTSEEDFLPLKEIIDKYIEDRREAK